MFIQKDFEIETVLNKPLMAHLSTVEQGEPRDSPVWFIWEAQAFGSLEPEKIALLSGSNKNLDVPWAL